VKPKEHYDRHAITISEQLARQYAKMNKSEILLHQYILSIAADEGIVKRNLSAAARELECSRSWLYTAEASLIMRGFLKTTRRNSTRFWKVITPSDEAEAEFSLVDEVPPSALDEGEVVEIEEMIDDVELKRRGFFSWLRKASGEGVRFFTHRTHASHAEEKQ
jgi:hypothetical protein